MTKPFDPHKPFTTREGRRRTLIAVLERPTPIGSVIIAQDDVGVLWEYGVGGKDLSSLGDDLINIPERIEVDAWAVIDINGRAVGLGYSKEYAVNCANQYLGARVVRLTGSYEG